MNNNIAAINTPLSMMEVYHLMRAFLDGDVESEEALNEMIVGIEKISPMIADDVMGNIRIFIDKLSELTYDEDIFSDCYAPECGHFYEDKEVNGFKMDTPAQTQLFMHRYIAIVDAYRVALDTFAENVLIPAIKK